MFFKDRNDAGRKLSSKLEHYAGRPNVIVLALPRGGVPVGFEVARHIRAMLDVFIVRKLGVPGQEELAMGAIASGGVLILNDYLIRQLRIGREQIEEAVEHERTELKRRESLYRHGRQPLELQSKYVILVDDGLATGASMRAAAKAVRKSVPSKLIVAVPVAASQTCEEFAREVDETICFATPEPFMSVGSWYMNFQQTTDDEVQSLLDAASRFSTAA